MKKRVSWSIYLVLSLCFYSYQAISQCEPVNPIPTGSFCEGQRAEFTINDPDPNNVYHWYRDGDNYDLGYGESGDGKYFVSPSDIPAGTSFVSYLYSRERPETVGPAGSIPSTGGQDAAFNLADYEMKFDSQTDFLLNSVTISAKVNFADPAKTWGFMVRIADATQLPNAAQGQFSDWFSYRFTTSGVENIVIPVNLLVKAGTNYTIQIKSGNATLNLSPVDNAYWYTTTSYPSTTFLNPGAQIKIDPVTKSIFGTIRVPLIKDWDISIKCPTARVTATVRTTGCCDKMGTNFQVNTPLAVVRDTDFPLALSVTGADAQTGFYYEWYDDQKNLIAGSEGVGKTTLTISKAGVYYVRIVKDAAFKGSFSCYKENSVLVQKRVLFATADKRTLCVGESSTLIASGATADIVWTPAAGLNSTTSKSVLASPSTVGKTTYRVSATVPVGNLVVDGDFDESTTASPKFETTYLLGATIPSGSPNGHAVIGNRASADWSPSGKFCDDTVGFYTGDRGRFMFADAQSSNANPVPASWGINNYIWQQSNLPVEIGKTYEFRFLVTDWGVESLIDPTKTSDVQMYVNGQPQLPVALQINKRCKWTEVKTTWTATTDRATLTIADVNAQNFGGEFAIDDVSFGAPGTQTDTVSIIVADCGFVTARKDTLVCMGEAVQLTAKTNGMVTGWTPKTDLSDSTSSNPIAFPVQNTEYTVEARFPEIQLFTNSDFSLGNVDFTSTLAFQNDAFYVGTNKYVINRGGSQPFYNTTKDYPSGAGSFMSVLAQGNVSRVIFSKSIPVVQNSVYGISFYLTNLAPVFSKDDPNAIYNWSDAEVQISIAGTVVKAYKSPQDRAWHLVDYTWTASATGNVTVEIISPRNINLNAPNATRAMGVDQITLASLGNAKTDKVVISTKECFTIDATTNGICKADSVKIQVETNGLFIGWTVVGGGTTGIMKPNQLETWVKPSVTTKYVASAQVQLGNMVSNGDFELGDKVGFTSDYTNGQNSGQYNVGKDPFVVYNGQAWVVSKKDHTSGSGLMYMSDGGSDPTKNVYLTTVNVIAGRQYAFSAWLANIHSGFLRPRPDTSQIKTTNLDFIINGQELGRIKLPLDTAWHQFYSVWTANVTGPITIAIRDRERAQGGNDFALDDIVFAPLLPELKTDTVEVNSCRVCNKPVVTLNITSSDTSICPGTSVTLGGRFANGPFPTSTSGLYYLWYKKGSAFSSTDYLRVPATNLIPDYPTIGNASYNSSGTYVLRVQDGNLLNDNACLGEDTLKLMVDTIPTFITQPGTLCNGNSLKLDTLVKGLLPKSATLMFYADTTGISPVAISSTVTSGGIYYAKAVSASVQCSRSFIYGRIVVSGFAKASIVTQPQPDGGCVGSIAGLDVVAAGTAPLQYQWYKGTTKVGKDSVGLRFPSLTTADSGDYKVEVTNLCGSETSVIAKISIRLNDDPRVDLLVNKTVVCTDSVVVLTARPSGGGTLRGYTFKESGTAISAVDQTSAVFVTSGLLTTPSFTVSMSYSTPCPAPGVMSPGEVTSDPKTVQVDQYVRATLKSISSTTCATALELPGGISPSVLTSTGYWIVASGSPNSAVIENMTDSISNLRNIPSPGKVELIWTVKNGVCPSDTAKFTVNQVGKMTTPTIQINGGVYTNRDITNGLADTLCVNSPYVLTGSTPNIGAGESGAWNVETTDANGISVSGSINTQTITPSGLGTTLLSWTISSTVAGCSPEIGKATLKVNEKPSISTIITPTTPLCEDNTTVRAEAQVKFTSTLKRPKFNWSVVSTGTGSATLINATDSIAKFSNFKSNARTGSKDSVIVTAFVSNACGFDQRNDTIVYRLKPRDFVIGDSILGPTTICESNSATWNYFGQKQLNTDSIKWSWNGVLQGTTENNPGVPEDTMLFYKSKTWGDIQITTFAIVTAQLGNVCGYYASKSRTDTIIPAVDFGYRIVSDKIQNSFCVPLDRVGVWAEQTSPDSNFYGNVAEYEFKTGATILQAQSAARGLKSMFPNSTMVTVVAYPDQSACLNNYDPKRDSIFLIGYNKPIDSLSVLDTMICEGEQPVQLRILPKSTDAGDFSWFRVVTGTPQNLNKNNVSPLVLTRPDESGLYYAVIDNALKKVDPNTQCPSTTTKTVAIKIFEKPKPVFSQNPLLIYYNDNSPGVKMPFVSTGTSDTVFDIHYDPGTWLSTQDSLVPTIKTLKEEIEITFTLTLKSGIKGGPECPGSGSIRVLNTLPLRIPNAFSPNGDSKNETWIIEGLGRYPNARVKVFNRWGNAIFTDNYGYQVPWDGTTNGSSLPMGTYYYVIDLLGSPDGVDEVRTGSLTIVK